jgi:alpha-tubulin suppressor-like RCC1 family protein
MPLTVGVDPLVRTNLALSGESVTVASTGANAIAIGTDKKAYVWGYNNFGQLGLPRAIDWARTPTKIDLPETVTAQNVAITDRSSFVVDTTGKVWMLGESELLDKTDSKIYSPVLFTPLSKWEIRDLAVSHYSRHGIALTSTGQVIAFGRNFSATALKSFAGLTIKKIRITHHNAFALDSLGDLYQLYIDENGFQSASKVAGLSNVTEFNTVTFSDDNWSQISVRTANGDIYYRRTSRSDSNLTFKKVSLPTGVIITSAAPMPGYGTLLVADTTGAVWQSSINHNQTTFEQSTWTRFSSATLGRLDSQDMPLFNDKGGYFLGFKSGRIMSFENDGIRGGRCGISWQDNDKTAAVISQGQFGPALNMDNPMYIQSLNLIVGTEAAKDLSDGAQIGVEPNSDLTLKYENFYSTCFPGNRMKIKADLDGSGQFATSPELSIENGSAKLVISTVAPASGRRTISIQFTTPLGVTKTTTLNVGVYSSTPNTLVTSRKSVFHADYNVSTVRGSDGKIYSWGGTNANRRLTSETIPRSVAQPIAINLLGSTSLRDAMVLGYGSDAVVLAVSATGKTYIWGARPGINMSATGYSSGSVPTTPTELPGLVGVDVVRIDGTGSRAVALTSGGVVYEWGDGNNRVPYRVAGLAGLTIVDIWSTDAINMALSSAGDLYTWRSSGNRLGWSTSSSDYWISAPWYWDPNTPIRVGKVPVGEAVKSAALTPYGTLVISVTDKLYFWGQSANFRTYQPVQRNLPGGRIPVAIGAGVDNYGTIVATDGTWWNPSSDSNDLLNFIQYKNIEIETSTGLLNSGVVDFARGSGRAVIKSNGTLVTYGGNHGTCGNVNNSFGQVMSDGQLGPIFKDDALSIYVQSGGGLIRPSTATSMSLTAYSNCFGGEGLTISADLTGTGVYTNPTLGTISEDGGSATSVFNFSIVKTGFITMQFKVTSTSGLTATTTSNVSVVPLPPAGRLIGISINGGARYTNSQNVIVDLVWPDGVTSITVSNDGGFAPGTFKVVDLQEHIDWQLPPQAVIPLPAIVYARFGDSTSYFFDDIIVDSIAPVLTYVAAR